MQQYDFEQFAAMWATACEPYGKNFIPTHSAIEFIFNALSRYELHEIARALSAHALNPDEGRFAPKPADIVKHLQGDNDSVTQIAWTKVLKTIQNVGAYESVVFDDPLIMAVIRDMGGWLELNRMTNDELPFKQREFVTRYRGFMNNPPRDYPKYFIGIADAENARNGHKVQAPLLIGSPERCAQIYHSGTNEKSKPKRLNEFIELTSCEVQRIEKI